jgi:polyphosphate kinase
VRVSDVKRRILINEVHGGDDEAKVLLRAIQQKVMALGEAFDNTYKELLIALARHNIFLVNESQLSESIQQWLRVFFREKVLRHIIPILLNKEVNPVKFLKDEHTYLAIEMKKNGQVIQYAPWKCPPTICPASSSYRRRAPVARSRSSSWTTLSASSRRDLQGLLRLRRDCRLRGQADPGCRI